MMDLKKVVSDEIKQIKPVLEQTITTVIHDVLPKSYSDVVKDEQNDIIEKAVAVNSAENVVNKVVEKLDIANLERDRRRNNAVVMGV